MSENTKRVAVRFGTGLPLGEHAVFKHDGKMWIAYPANKQARIMAVIDRMIGIHARITADMVRWINSHPQDGERVAWLAAQAWRAQKLGEQVVDEKIKAVTS